MEETPTNQIPSQPIQTQNIIPPHHEGLSHDTKTIIVILLLLFFYPAGLIMMWVWMKWPTWVKLLLSIGVVIFLLMVLGIIFAMALATIDPKGQIDKANDTIRYSDTNAILNAISQYKVDNNNTLPPQITNEAQEISSSGSNICNELVPKYMKELPVDPTINNGENISGCPTPYSTGYNILLEPDGRVTVSAPHATTRDASNSR